MASAEDKTRVREALGEGLRKFYDSVLDEPIPAEWMNLVGGSPDQEDR
ncbi:MAG: NepR family anti-sigma factor [Pseudomonadota bacterium]